MFIRKLHLTNYKNHEKKVFSFDNDVTAFVGLNGVGKTNILDAIYMLCIGKSYFSSSDKHCVRHGESFFRLSMEVSDSAHKNVVLTYEMGKRKKIVVDDLQLRKSSEHIGRFPTVVVSPNDHILITGSADERRKFIDQSLSQLSTEYLQDLINYNNALKQRNAMLKQAEEFGLDQGLLAIYNEKLDAHGTRIFQSRSNFFNQIEDFFKESFKALSSKDEGFSMTYKSHLEEGSLLKQLKENLSRDLILRRTSKGIHKDDVKFNMTGGLIKDFGSQGQQKTFLFALKLTQFNFFKAQLKKVPLFIIDDIFDKLDQERSQNLIKFLIKQQGQVFISNTDEHIFQSVINVPVQIEKIK